MAAL
ncbi:hypothetical protein YPPY47_2984, partial [Yersinia pestis PY-47]|jgi:hypothetical protein